MGEDVGQINTWVYKSLSLEVKDCLERLIILSRKGKTQWRDTPYLVRALEEINVAEPWRDEQ